MWTFEASQIVLTAESALSSPARIISTCTPEVVDEVETMSSLITDYADHETFARAWDDYENALHGKDADLRMLWQLLGLLPDDELLVHLPEWLAEEKVGYVEGNTPTAFVGRIEEETEKAILFADSASARSLMKLAHRIHHLQQGLEKVTDDHQRRDHLQRRLEDKQQEFEAREEVTELHEEWLPKSQIIRAVRRTD